MRFITPTIGRMAKGSSTCTMATSTATRVKISCSGWSITPRASRAAFSGPSRWSRMNQAVVRTRIDTQNGTSTSTVASRAQPGESRAMV